MQAIAETISATKRYGDRAVVDDLSFSAKRGHATALLGPNGAGKTTTLEMLQGLRAPDQGEVKLFGRAPKENSVRKRLGVTLQGVDFPENLTAAEIIEFAAAHYEECENMEALSQAFGLEKLLPRQLGGFSGGEKRRVALALAFVGKPELVFLDEPTTGLDDASQIALRNYIRRYVDKGGSVILTSHSWPEIEEVADQIVMIDAGKKVLQGDIGDIRKAAGLNRIRFEVDRPEDWMSDFQRDGNALSSITERSDELVRKLVESGVRFSSLTIEPVSLKEAIAAYRSANPATGDVK